MSPSTRKLYLFSTAAILVAFCICLLTFAEGPMPPPVVPDDIPLASLVRLYRIEENWFPVVFLELERHGLPDKRNWDLVLRVTAKDQFRIYGHQRIGDRIRRTDYQIADIHYVPAPSAPGADPRGTSIILKSPTRQVRLYRNQPARDPEVRQVYSLVFFPRTPVRGLANCIPGKMNDYLTLKHADRTETYRLEQDQAGRPQLQKVVDGKEVGAPVKLLPYDENEHARWLQQHRP